MISCKIASHLFTKMIGEGLGGFGRVGGEGLRRLVYFKVEVGVGCYAGGIGIVLYYACVKDMVSYRDIKGSFFSAVLSGLVSILIVKWSRIVIVRGE